MKGGCFSENYIELQFTLVGDVAIGTSYQYMDTGNYIKKRMNGSYVPASKTLTVQEGDVTTYKIPGKCVVCIKNFELVYAREGNTETLTGSWTGQVMNTGVICQPGTIFLSRIKEPLFKEPPVPLIKVDTGDIRLDFYDNGTIDGDSISVRVNNNTVVSHQRLSAKPVTIIIKINPAVLFQEVEMIAENLGSIPPNTALLLITAGKKRYRLFLTSTKANSAAVQFVYSTEEGFDNHLQY